MGGEADDGIGAGQAAGLGNRDVVLADVDAVGLARCDEVGTVVDQEERAMAIGRGAKVGCGAEQALVARILVAQLDQVDAAGQGRFQQPLEGGGLVPVLANEVEPGALELVGGARHCPASVVNGE